MGGDGVERRKRVVGVGAPQVEGGQDAPQGPHGGLLAHNADVGPGEACGGVHHGRPREVGVRVLSSAQQGAEHGFSRVGLRQRHQDALLQPAQHGGVQLPGEVGGGQDEHELVGVCAQAVHLDEQLRLEPPAGLVLAGALAARADQRVDLVQEDRARGEVAR